MLVRFLSARTYKAHCLTYPIRVFKQYIEEIGIDVKFHFKPGPFLNDCDVLCIVLESLVPSRLNPNPPERNDFLSEMRKKTNTIIWFDTTDGTGTTSFSVLPYVDLYAKNQLLKDRNLYTKQYYGNEIYSDYYHRLLNIEDGEFTSRPRSPINIENINKLALSWNLGLGDFTTFASYWRHLRIFSPKISYNFNSSPVRTNRPIDVSLRGRLMYNQMTFSYQRQQTQKSLSDLSHKTGYQIAYGGKLPYSEYKEEISRSKLVISPFGLGEICFRDFECFLGGALLVKPDMSHLETWPDYFLPDQTYISHAWDFSDFLEKLIELLENPGLRTKIAETGQEEYQKNLSSMGGEAFACHFLSIIKKAIIISSKK